jgi:hypothetical protein
MSKIAPLNLDVTPFPPADESVFRQLRSFLQPFPALARRERSFHNQCAHWRQEKTFPLASEPPGNPRRIFRLAQAYFLRVEKPPGEFSTQTFMSHITYPAAEAPVIPSVTRVASVDDRGRPRAEQRDLRQPEHVS